MTDLIKTAALFVTTPDCYEQYFLNFNFFHGECMKTTLSKVLGLIVVVCSITVKVPQILKIIKNRSGEGILVLGVSLELFAINSFFLYCYLNQFPFSAWGDGLFMSIQTVIVLGLILHYNKQKKELGLFIVTFSTLMYLFLSGIIPLSVLWALQFAHLPVIFVGKGVQALSNYKRKNTGQLSAITCWMQFGGAVVRVFTSVQETGDIAVILSFVLASVMNGIIVFQLLYYAKSAPKKGGKKDKGKSKGKKSE